MINTHPPYPNHKALPTYTLERGVGWQRLFLQTSISVFFEMGPEHVPLFCVGQVVLYFVSASVSVSASVIVSVLVSMSLLVAVSAFVCLYSSVPVPVSVIKCVCAYVYLYVYVDVDVDLDGERKTDQ